MRIAICDDEASLIEDLKKAVMASSAWDPDATVSGHADGESLLAEHERNPYDIVFLDIEMDGMSGMEAGHRIRENDKEVFLIFVTSHKQFIEEAFIVEAFDYVSKPITSEKINDVIERVLKKYISQHQKVSFESMGNIYSLYVTEIIRIEGKHGRITFFTNDKKGEYKCYGSLDGYERDLSSHGFIRSHRNVIVNMKYIKSIEEKHIIIECNNKQQEVKVSVRKRQNCKRAYNTYLTKYLV